MISVIVPIMRIPPYDSQIKDLLKCLGQQTIEHEVIISEQKIRKYIDKNKLLNQGFKKARGKYIWHCDADFIVDDNFLKRMRNSLELNKLDVIFPMFFSNTNQAWRIADGAPFMKREVLERHGDLDESLMGISFVTFPFLDWCLDNTKFHCSPNFKIGTNRKPFIRKSKDKADPVTLKKMRPESIRIMKRLIAKGLVPPGIMRSNVYLANKRIQSSGLVKFMPI